MLRGVLRKVARAADMVVGCRWRIQIEEKGRVGVGRECGMRRNAVGLAEGGKGGKSMNSGRGRQYEDSIICGFGGWTWR